MLWSTIRKHLRYRLAVWYRLTLQSDPISGGHTPSLFLSLSSVSQSCPSEVSVWGWCGRKQVHSRCSGKEVSSLGVMFSISNRDADVKERAVILGHASYWLSGEYLSLIVAAPHRDWRLSNLLWTSDFISASLPFLGEILFAEVASMRERKSQIMRAIQGNRAYQEYQAIARSALTWTKRLLIPCS